MTTFELYTFYNFVIQISLFSAIHILTCYSSQLSNFLDLIQVNSDFEPNWIDNLTVNNIWILN